jgi:hypothetical protein
MKLANSRMRVLYTLRVVIDETASLRDQNKLRPDRVV